MKAVLAACTVCHLNQHYERTDQVFFALPSHPTCDVSVDFLDMSVKDRAGTTRRSHHLSSRFAAQRHVHGMLAGEYRHPFSNTFMYFII
jgi:hypothetical protein